MNQNEPTFDVLMMSGQEVYFKNANSYMVNESDIARYTGGLTRYNGGIPWTVMQHHLLCIAITPFLFPNLDRETLQLLIGYIAMHDEHEIIVGDLSGGMRKWVPDYDAIETEWEKHFHDSQGLPLNSQYKDQLHLIDKRAQAIEMRYFVHPGASLWEAKTTGKPVSQDEYAAIRGAIYVTEADGEDYYDRLTTYINHIKPHKDKAREIVANRKD